MANQKNANRRQLAFKIKTMCLFGHIMFFLSVVTTCILKKKETKSRGNEVNIAEGCKTSNLTRPIAQGPFLAKIVIYFSPKSDNPSALTVQFLYNNNIQFLQ